MCHIIANNNILKANSILKLFGNWGTDAVIVFFILSGIVIGITQAKKPTTTLQFVYNRLTRIYPIYIVGLMLAIVALTILKLNNVSAIKTFIENLFFVATLQGHIVNVPITNPVVWSLSFEIFFYLIFALTIGKYQSKLMLVWLIISLACIPFYYMHISGFLGYLVTMFSFSIIWLIGFYIYKYRNYFSITNYKVALLFVTILPIVSRLTITNEYYCIIKYILFSVIAIPVFVYTFRKEPETNTASLKITQTTAVLIMAASFLALYFFSNSLFTSKVVYCALPVIALLFSILKIQFFGLNIIKKGAVYFGSISYAVYIIHFPILLLLAFWVQNIYLYLLCACVVTILVSSFLELKFQKYFQSILKNK